MSPSELLLCGLLPRNVLPISCVQAGLHPGRRLVVTQSGSIVRVSRLKPTSDIFVSYATDDADLCTNDLTMALWEVGVNSLWIDRIVIKHGDSIPKRVDEGLARTRYLLPIVTPMYFVKPWTQRELDAIRMLEKPALPIWVNVDAKTVKAFSPTLATQKALIYQNNPYEIAEQVAEFLQGDKRTHFYKSTKARAEAKLFWQLAWVFTLDEIRGENFAGRDFLREQGTEEQNAKFLLEVRSAVGLSMKDIQARAAVIRAEAQKLGNKITDDDVAHILVGSAKRSGSSFAYEPRENKALKLIGIGHWR